MILHFTGEDIKKKQPFEESLMDKFTCLRMMSMVCMMQRGMSPWFRAKIIACSNVTFKVHLQERWQQVSTAVHMSTCWTPAVKTNADSQATRHSICSCANPWFQLTHQLYYTSSCVARLTSACLCHTSWCGRLPGGCTAPRTRTARWRPTGGLGRRGARWRMTALAGRGRPACWGVAAATVRRERRINGLRTCRWGITAVAERVICFLNPLFFRHIWLNWETYSTFKIAYFRNAVHFLFEIRCPVSQTAVELRSDDSKD